MMWIGYIIMTVSLMVLTLGLAYALRSIHQGVARLERRMTTMQVTTTHLATRVGLQSLAINSHYGKCALVQHGRFAGDIRSVFKTITGEDDGNENGSHDEPHSPN